MPAVYEEFGVRFLFPENWTITDQDIEGWPRTVSVQSPSGAFWSLHLYPADKQPRELVDEVQRTMGDEYDDLETEPADEECCGLQAVGCNMHFYCLDWLVSASARAMQVPRATFLLVYQAESREFEEIKPVFQAITISLLKEWLADE